MTERRNEDYTMWEKYPVFKKDDFSELKVRSDYEEGIAIFYLESWEQYYNELLPKMEKQKDTKNRKILDYYQWRGQRCDNWGLLSSFDRWYRKKVANRNEKHRGSLLKKHLKVFRTKLEEAIGIRYTKEDVYWALAQHYGLDTPLLDWTKDPYRAAYFAFYKEPDANQKSYRAIYALSKKTQILLRKSKNKIKDKTKAVIRQQVVGKERFLKVLDTFAVDATQNTRLQHQKGMFTKALNGDDVETNIRRLYERRTDIQEDEKIILFNILIPNQERYKALQWLKDQKGIQYTKLFPDPEGAVEACKMELRLIQVR